MPTGTIRGSLSVGDLAQSTETSRTASGQIAHEVTLPAGKTGTLSTRTDDDTGVATLEADHGITTEDTVDVYWDGGLRYGMSVTLVDGNDVTIDLGTGDVLPTQDTSLVVTPRVSIDTDFDGDLAKLVVAHADKRAHIDFQSSAPASLHAVELVAGELWSWVDAQGISNPLTGDPVDTVEASAGTAAATVVKLGVIYASS